MDFGSTDNTYDVVARAAEHDGRIHLARCPEQFGWYEREGDQVEHVFRMADGVPYQWYNFLDADDIPNVTVQALMRAYLYDRYPNPGHIGVRWQFLYLCPDWTHYYAELSAYPDCALWSFRPQWGLTGIGGRQILNPPAAYVDLPVNYQIVHFNYPMAARFEKKRRLYEVRWGHPSWHPDEKYKARNALDRHVAFWYAPDGREVGPDDMPAYGLERAVS